MIEWIRSNLFFLNTNKSLINDKKSLPIFIFLFIGIFITDHNVRETLAITDSAYILNEGVILAFGPSKDVSRNPLVIQHYLGEGFRF